MVLNRGLSIFSCIEKDQELSPFRSLIKKQLLLFYALFLQLVYSSCEVYMILGRVPYWYLNLLVFDTFYNYWSYENLGPELDGLIL